MDSEAIGNMDADFRDFSIANLEHVDCILLGRKTASDLIPYWASVAENPSDSDFLLGKKITDTPKIVYSKTRANAEWPNTTLAQGEIVDAINKLKNHAGKDIMVYGSVSFASSLIKNGLVDEYYLAVNPVALGRGLPIFKELEGKLSLTLVTSRSFACGIVLLQYEPQND